MPFRHSPDFWLISQAAAAAFVAARLLQFRLHSRAPFLFSYLAISVLFDAAGSILAQDSTAYVWVYLIFTPIVWCVECLAVFEMFRLIFRDFPGLRTVGKWAVCAAIGFSAIVPIWAVASPFSGGSTKSQLVFYEVITDRSEHFSLAIIILFLMVCLSRYPLHLDRNVYVASGFFGAIFLVQSIVRLIDTLSPKLIASTVDSAEVAFTAVCFAGWGIMLRGARAAVPARPAVNPARETELLHQLEAMNALLSSSVRR